MLNKVGKNQTSHKQGQHFGHGSGAWDYAYFFNKSIKVSDNQRTENPIEIGALLLK